MFVPSTNTIKRWRLNIHSLTNNNYDIDNQDIVTLSSIINLANKYVSEPETKPFILKEDRNIHFVSEFCYLGISIDFLLNNTHNIQKHVNKEIKVIGTLKFIWDSD